MNVREYWLNVREIQASLPDVVFITSESEPPGTDIYSWRSGVVVEVDAETAAKMIVGRTHRRSTPEEIERCCADKQRAKHDAEVAELVHKGYVNIEVGLPQSGKKK